MAKIVESHVDVLHDSIGTLDVDLSHADKDFKLEWDATSTYQVKNLVNFSYVENIKKNDTIDHLRFDLLVSNKEKSALIHELKKLKEKLFFLEKSPSVLKMKNTFSNSKPEDQSKTSTSDDSSMHHETHDKLKRNQNLILKERIQESKFVINVVMLLTKSGKEHIWYLDNGCSRHMSGFKSLLEDFIEKDGSNVTYKDNGNYVVFKSVCYVKGLQHNLISISQLCDAGYEVLFNKRKGKVLDQRSVIVLSGNQHNEIYVLDMFSADNSLCLYFFSFAQYHLNWMSHKRLSHLYFKNISKISGNQLVRGIPRMQKKSHAADEIIVLIKLWEVLYDHKVRKLHNDHGTEFRNCSLEDFCSNSGIYQNFSIVRTPQQNGISERRNKTLIESVRTMVVETGLPLFFCVEAVNTACYTQNQSIIVKHHGKNAYESLKGRKPNISYFHVFGYVCCILNKRDQYSKFEAKDDEGIFLGYSSLSKAFKVASPEEAKPSNKEDFAQSNINENSNPRNLRDHPESLIIVDINSRILTRSRVNINFCMFVNFISMIEPKNVVDALKEVDWIKAMQNEMNEFERHRVWTLVPKPQGKTIFGTQWVFR
ncbi:uncharacterized protein LOC111898952 [Lactuca sativa]|uniref:uncharacterized protein LOC111898952 n=1 Tax=Lactuca sativa TaxID=4236 RepID=UPI000CD80CFF|nr:uncharacterized protein LOC111898952 [Lactuca sativa]